MKHEIITIVGAGMMGSAMAIPAHDNGHEVRLVGTPLDREIIDTLQKTGHHKTLNRDMHAGRCASLLDHMLNGPLIFLRIQFFVFLIVIPRMCAFVADAAFVFFLFFHKMFSLYFKYI